MQFSFDLKVVRTLVLSFIITYITDYKPFPTLSDQGNWQPHRFLAGSWLPAARPTSDWVLLWCSQCLVSLLVSLRVLDERKGLTTAPHFDADDCPVKFSGLS